MLKAQASTIDQSDHHLKEETFSDQNWGIIFALVRTKRFWNQKEIMKDKSNQVLFS